MPMEAGGRGVVDLLPAGLDATAVIAPPHREPGTHLIVRATTGAARDASVAMSGA
jgi:hypothetical protein